MFRGQMTPTTGMVVFACFCFLPTVGLSHIASRQQHQNAASQAAHFEGAKHLISDGCVDAAVDEIQRELPHSGLKPLRPSPCGLSANSKRPEGF
jgi:hypothetical protein